MTWFEFFNLPEDATYEEMKSTYVRMLQENKSADSETIADIKYYYKEASNYFKNKQENVAVSEKSTSDISKVTFKEMDVEELDEEEPVKRNSFWKKVLNVLFIALIFIPFVITEAVKWLIKHKRVLVFFITIAVSFSVFVINRQTHHAKPEVKPQQQTSVQVPIEMPLTKEALQKKRLNEANEVYRTKKSTSATSKEALDKVLLATTCTMKFPEEYYYKKELTNIAEKNVKQKEYDSCYDIYDN